jgi:hypothetical protein
VKTIFIRLHLLEELKKVPRVRDKGKMKRKICLRRIRKKRKEKRCFHQELKHCVLEAKMGHLTMPRLVQQGDTYQTRCLNNSGYLTYYSHDASTHCTMGIILRHLLSVSDNKFHNHLQLMFVASNTCIGQI